MRTRRRHVIGGGRGTSQQCEQSASAVFIRQPWSTLRWPPSNFVMECGYTCEPIAVLFVFSPMFPTKRFMSFGSPARTSFITTDGKWRLGGLEGSSTPACSGQMICVQRCNLKKMPHAEVSRFHVMDLKRELISS